MLGLSAAALAGVLAMFFLKKPMAPMFVAGAAAGTYGFSFFLFLVVRGLPAGLGLWLGLLGGLAAAGACVFCSLKDPWRLPPFNKEGASPMLRDWGAMGGACGIALLLGVLLVFTM
jgi:hypothetical protein